MTTGLVVIDMQVGLFDGEPPCHDADGVIKRINALARGVRAAGGSVFLVQHENEGKYAQGSDLWQLLPKLAHEPEDVYIGKTASDCFYRSDLERRLRERGVDRLLVTGCATEFCVDTTIRSAMSKDFDVVVASDGHTTKSRHHARAETIIAHHNWVWSNLVLPGHPVRVAPVEQILAGL
jgi:nicotinamidase-related amidase